MLTTFLTSSENWRPFLQLLNLEGGDDMKNVVHPLRLFDRNPAAGSCEAQSGCSAKYQRHVDCMDQSHHDDGQKVCDDSRPNERRRRGINFSFQPEKYEPLKDDEGKEMKKRKKQNYKKVKKNVGKALRTTWKCLMLGLYNFALVYSTPITVAAAFAPDFHPDRSRA